MAYQERVGSIAKASAGFGMEGGRASIEYQMPWDEVTDFCKDCLGSVTVDGGSLKRTLPKAHPVYSWLFAERVSTIEGFQYNTTDMSDSQLEAPAIEYYAKYNYAKVVVEFAPRPYSLFADESIGTDTVEHYNDGGVATTKDVTYEYWRYTTYKTKPSVEYLTAQHGQFRMAGTDPDGIAFPGQVRLIKKSKALAITWHQVPQSVAEGDNIYNGLGRVNQHDWWGYAAGTLLFLGYETSDPVPPPFPEMVTDPDIGTGVPATEKIVNITFNFQYSEPELGAPSSPSNASFIAYGHNVVPWFKDGAYYYATTGTTQAQDPVEGIPAYLSYPFELLFTPS